MFDPLNAALTQWADIPPDDQEAFRAIAMEGWVVQHYFYCWTDNYDPSYIPNMAFRFHPYAMALRNIIALTDADPAIFPDARTIAKAARDAAETKDAGERKNVEDDIRWVMGIPEYQLAHRWW